MRWKTKTRFDPKPTVGQRRHRQTFAWFPVRCREGITVWLGKVKIIEEYQTWKVEEGDMAYSIWETTHYGWKRVGACCPGQSLLGPWNGFPKEEGSES